ncbi:MAG: 4Fe-4S binding protein [Deltaproteobacteria bacterium]|nr:4Fe-4S binding protein [Deltaproteobacteria bacterium]
MEIVFIVKTDFVVWFFWSRFFCLAKCPFEIIQDLISGL